MEKKRQDPGTVGGRVDAEKIGGVAPVDPDWGKEYPSDPAAAGDKPTRRDERGGTPKSA
jgi:hypothetical protein